MSRSLVHAASRPSFWMRHLMEVIASNRVDLTPLVTHRVKLDDIEISYDLFSHQRDGVLKVAITP